jgi:hypothetical protein
MDTYIRYSIVETDNFDCDYPGEVWVNIPSMNKEIADMFCDLFNKHFSDKYASRYYKVVDSNYTLKPGFEA